MSDGGYDSAAFRDWLRARRIEPVIPQRGRKEIIGLGTIRWVVEQAIAHLVVGGGEGYSVTAGVTFMVGDRADSQGSMERLDYKSKYIYT